MLAHPRYWILIRMKKYLLLLLGMIVSLFPSMSATSLEDHYIMKIMDDGQLYFITPFDIPAQMPKMKAASADITYLTNADSVTMNISVWAKQELLVDSIVIAANGKIVRCEFQVFFIEMERKLWIHRYSLHYPLNDLVAIYKSPVPYTLHIYAKEQDVQYAYSSKLWVKESVWMNRILHIILSNKALYGH